MFVHECFREVRSIEDLVDAQSRATLIDRARRRASVEKGEPISDRLVEDVSGTLERIATEARAPGSVASALELRGDPGECRVLAELGFVREIGGGLVNGRIDRLELSLRGGMPVGATVIDFKTGAVDISGDKFKEKVAAYRAQLSAYGDAVAEMFAIPRETVRLKLLFVDRGESLELSG